MIDDMCSRLVVRCYINIILLNIISLDIISMIISHKLFHLNIFIQKISAAAAAGTRRDDDKLVPYV